jgi:hypothetical protein
MRWNSKALRVVETHDAASPPKSHSWRVRTETSSMKLIKELREGNYIYAVTS